MAHFYEHINLLIMPTDACNMNCVYCFHKPYTNNVYKMNMETVKQLFDITALHYKTVNVIWHGGEPLLMGLQFYKDVLELQRSYSCRFTNSVQSNLTLLTPELADFFAENNIDISGSFDGICNEQSRGRSDDILTCRELMIKRGKRCGFIMVVSGLNIDHLIESYNFFKKLDVSFSLNLYLDQKDNRSALLQLQEETAIFRLNELFDYWASDVNGKTHISYFKNILDFLLQNKKTLCSYTSCLGRWMGVHFDGALSPCNRYFPSEYSLGNVYDYNDIGEAFESPGFQLLIQEAIERRNKCKQCEIFDFCNGGCNNVALNEHGVQNNGGLSCRILKAVYKHIDEFISNVDINIDNGSINPLLVKMISTAVVKEEGACEAKKD